MAQAENAPKPSPRIPTPMVLAGASAMVCIGVVAAYLSTLGPDGESAAVADEGGTVAVDTSTPERTAESFLDAWRKREHEVCLALSTGRARETVTLRAEEDTALGAAERELKERVWDSMAETRLTLQIRESENLDQGRIALRGTAEGTFLDRPYSREVEFVLAPAGDRWLVQNMELGDILNEMPEFLKLDPGEGRDPSEFEIRGADVP